MRLGCQQMGKEMNRRFPVSPIATLTLGIFLVLVWLIYDQTKYTNEYLNPGKALYRSGNYNAAIIDLKGFIQHLPGDSHAHYDLALCFWQKGEMKQALLEFAKAKRCEQGAHDPDAEFIANCQT